MTKDRLKGDLLLILTTMIWGTAFVFQKTSMDFVGPITLNVLRSVLAVAALSFLILFRDMKEKSRPDYVAPTAEEKARDRKNLIKASLCCGLPFSFACVIQNTGLQYTSAGKGAFITVLYVILVPIIKRIGGNRMGTFAWIGVFLACIGLFLICLPSGEAIGGINKGDILIFCCAFAFAVQIIEVDKYVAIVDGVKLSFMQFVVVIATSIIPMFIFEQLNFEAIWEGKWQILYLGIMSSAVAYTLQIIGQKLTDPVSASILMSLESVFAFIAGVLILHEVMALRVTIGCAIMFSAVILSQLPDRKRDFWVFTKEKV